MNSISNWKQRSFIIKSWGFAMPVRNLMMMVALALLVGCTSPAPGTEEEEPTGVPQTLTASEITPNELLIRKRVYVPVYSKIFWKYALTTELAITVAVRNVSPDQSLFLLSVKNYALDGTPIDTYLDQTSELAPLAAAVFAVPTLGEADDPGASFVVEWGAQTAVPDPVIETVMFGQEGNAGISFSSRGTTIDEHRQVVSVPE